MKVDSPIAQPLDPGEVHRLADGTPLEEQVPETIDQTARTAGRRQQLVSGLTWGVAFQGVEVVLSFVAMLVLVRVIPPVDYGRAAATAGVLGIFAIVNAHLFIAHALQLPEDETPDWSLHWSVAFYLQTALFLVCHAIAAVCWIVPAYTPIAKLLHVAAFGLLFQAGNHLGATMLRRELRFRRLKIIAAIGIFFRLAIIVGLGLAGARAYAIVVGNNVIASLPYAIDLFLVRGWRPQAGWWRLREWRRYTAAARFGSERTAIDALSSARFGAETVILPATLGFTGIGLVNRAQALYTTTFGRLGTVFADTVYPFLPRESKHPDRFAAHATLYLEMTLLLAIPSALFVGQQGRLLSRILYGTKWIAADPLIWPGALIGVAGAAYTAAAGILLARGCLRVCIALDAAAVVSAVPGWWVAWTTSRLPLYTWVLAATQLLHAVLSIACVARLLKPGWLRTAVLPPVAAALVALAVARAVSPLVAARAPVVQLGVITVAFSAALLLVLRACFARGLTTVTGHLPGGAWVQRLLGLRPQGVAGAPVPRLVAETTK